MKREVVLLKEVSVLVIVAASLLSWASSQTVQVHAKPLTDADVQLVHQDLQSMRNKVISDTMNFNEKEAAAFWPVYKEYAAAQHSIADERLALITEYARSLDRMDDTSARSFTQRMFALDDETQNLRKGYFSRFESALGAKRAARFYQVDNRLTQIVNFQLASEIPLIP